MGTGVDVWGGIGVGVRDGKDVGLGIRGTVGVALARGTRAGVDVSSSRTFKLPLLTHPLTCLSGSENVTLLEL